ncbi:MAG: UvrD-helicase domain-containing protein [Rickettsiales bacterium]|nr:UvrD-helicase domain-containing protein [Rickettsiales bacterium]
MQATNPNNSFFISANAGSGKTKILIDRITALILSGARPQEILAITFTNNAACEIRARIIKNFITIFAANPRDQIALLTELLGREPEDYHFANLAKIKQDILLGSAKFNIQTIHSFALELLRNYSYEAELRPGFTVMSNVDSNKIIGEITSNIYARPELRDNFNYLAERISIEAISEHLRLITDKRSGILYLLFKAGNLANQFTKMQEMLGLPEDVPESLQLKRDFLMHTELQKVIKLVTDIDQSLASKTDQAQIGLLQSLSFDNEFRVQQSFVKAGDVFCTKLGTIKVNLFSKKLSNSSPDLIVQAQSLAAEYLELKQYLAKINAFEINKTLLEVALILLNEYQSLKQEQNLLDYEDILLKSLILLSTRYGDNINYHLDSVKHILVDEAQDTSIMQWEIIHHLYSDFLTGGLAKTIFIVGDEKQSIYGFQGARHELFKQKYDELSTALELRESKLIKLDLVKSYRSSPGIIGVVNLFCQHHVITDSLTQFDIDLTHQAHRDSSYLFKLLPFCKRELGPKTKLKLEFPATIISKESNYGESIAQITSEINRLIAGNYYLESESRPARYEDILILFPRRNDYFTELYHALNDQSIPVSLDGSRSVSDDIIFLDYLALLRFSYMPCDDYNLASLLKSPLFNFDDKILETLCSSLDKQSDASQSLYDLIESEVFEWSAGAKSVLNLIIDKSRYLSPYNFCLNITHHFDLLTAYDDEFAGDSKIRVGKILDLILEFEHCYGTSYHALYKALLSHDLIVKNSGASNSIRLMSIHGSKGLEAPIVILADSNSKVTLNKDKLYFTDDNLLFTIGSEKFPEKEAIIAEYNNRLESEFKRLNYVALTRAKDVLILAGNGSKIIEHSLYHIIAEELEKQEGVDIDKIYDQGYELGTLEQRDQGGELKIATLDLIPQTKKFSPQAENMEDDYHKKLGIIIHNILDDLQMIKPEDKVKFIEGQLNRQDKNISAADKDVFRQNLTEIITDPKFEYLFKSNSQDEIELLYNQKLIRIDKLIIMEDYVEIIDYKTDLDLPSNANEVKSEYQDQLALYAAAVQLHYPNKKIKQKLFYLRHKSFISL